MDWDEYTKINPTSHFVDREELIGLIDSSDDIVLANLARNLKDGYLNYLSLDLSDNASKKVLETSDDFRYRSAAYCQLIDNRMLMGTDYRDILRKALEEGIVPYFDYTDNPYRDMLLEFSEKEEDCDRLIDSLQLCCGERRAESLLPVRCTASVSNARWRPGRS